jgi:hypothetical protein
LGLETPWSRRHADYIADQAEEALLWHLLVHDMTTDLKNGHAIFACIQGGAQVLWTLSPYLILDTISIKASLIVGSNLWRLQLSCLLLTSAFSGVQWIKTIAWLMVAL